MTVTIRPDERSVAPSADSGPQPARARRLLRAVLMTTVASLVAVAANVGSPVAAPAHGAETVLLTEDFSGEEMPSGWEVVEGDWSVVDGALRASTGDERARISFGPAAPWNFALETTVRFESVANAARWLNIGLDYHAAEDYGAVLVARSGTTASNGLELAQKSTPSGGWSSSPVAPAPDAIGVGEDHTLLIEVHGRNLTVRLDGVVAMTAANLTRTGGSFGFVINNSTVVLDDIELRELSGDAEPDLLVDGYPVALDGHAWPSGHVQGVAFDPVNRVMYYSFTNLLVKTDLAGDVLGTLAGWTGHLGDLDFGDDGRVYGSLEYKAQRAFYIAVIEGDTIDRVGMRVDEDAEVFRTVYLPEAVADYSADMDGNGIFDGDVGSTPDHRYGASGIDGVSFGPAFGSTSGTRYLTVAYGIYQNNSRTDNDYQVLLQYDTSGWDAYLDVLDEASPHHSGPADVDGKYFVYTGNTTYGVQNLEYDEWLERWFLGVYTGSKPEFPNYSLFAVDAAVAARPQALVGQPDPEQGMVLPLATDGRRHAASGVTGWMQKADVGFEALGDGLYYTVASGSSGGQQTATAQLVYWTGRADQPFAPATAGFRTAPAAAAPTAFTTTAGEAFSGSVAAAGSAPASAYRIASGTLPGGVGLVAATGELAGSPTTAGSWDVAITADNGSAEPATTTARVTVVAGAAATLDVDLGAGPIRVGDTLRPVVTGRDRFGNPTGALAYTLASSTSADVVGGAFAPRTAGSRVLTVTSGALQAEVQVGVLAAAEGVGPGDAAPPVGIDRLASTGLDGQPMLAWIAALFALVAGTTAVIVSRRRKHQMTR